MFITIEADHVGKAHINAFGRVWPVRNFIGRILEQDVGKRVFLRGGILQVENDDQRNSRLARTGESK